MPANTEDIIRGLTAKREKQLDISPLFALASPGVRQSLHASQPKAGMSEDQRSVAAAKLMDAIEGRRLQEKNIDVNEALRRKELELREKELNARREQFRKKIDLERSKIADKLAKAGNELSVGQKAIDKEFGKQYADWQLGGGFSTVQNDLKALNLAIDELQADPELVGYIQGNVPRSVRLTTDKGKKSLALQTNIEKVVQKTIKQVLDARFTQEEAQMFLQRSFDPGLTPEQNINKLRNSIKEIEDSALEKQRSIQHFAQNGTLSGFQPAQLNAEPTREPAAAPTESMSLQDQARQLLESRRRQ